MDLIKLIFSCLLFASVIYADFFRDLEKLDIDSQLNEIDKMLNKIEVDEDEALNTLMDRGADKTADKAANMFDNIFDTDCKYKCPDGSKPKVRKSHKPSSNGCGSFGISFELEDLPEMTSCCNEHDMCYDTCGSDRDVCDDKFKGCLDKMCKKLKKDLSKKEHQGCKDMSKLMYTGTLALGCSPYLKGQEAACMCDSEAKGADRKSNENPKTETKPKGNTSKTGTKGSRADNTSSGKLGTNNNGKASEGSRLNKKDEL